MQLHIFRLLQQKSKKYKFATMESLITNIYQGFPLFIFPNPEIFYYERIHIENYRKKTSEDLIVIRPKLLLLKN